MPMWKNRLVDESSQLQCKISRLTSFLSGDDSKDVQCESRLLLQKQLKVMREYHRILEHRLELSVSAPPPPPPKAPTPPAARRLKDGAR